MTGRNMQMVPRQRTEALEAMEQGKAPPGPATPASSPSKPPVSFAKSFTPEEKARHKAGLVKALRERARREAEGNY